MALSRIVGRHAEVATMNYWVNSRIERAAIGAARRYFSSRGWSVKSREKENRGFDLECQQGTRRLHVEVKGIRGNALCFILTAGEQRCSLSDPRFRVALVVDAMTKPWVRLFTTKKLVRGFEMKPLAYKVTPVRSKR